MAGTDPIARRAALWATIVAVPVVVLVAALLVSFADRPQAPPPHASASAQPQVTSAVTMPAAAISERAAAVCRALVAGLPDVLRDLPRRPVTAGAERNTAYGEPPITLACGVPPVPVAPTDFLLTMDRVCWHAAETAAATIFTTVDRQVPVQVTVPTSYEQRGQWANEFSGAVLATVPAAREAPSGCAR